MLEDGKQEKNQFTTVCRSCCQGAWKTFTGENQQANILNKNNQRGRISPGVCAVMETRDGCDLKMKE